MKSDSRRAEARHRCSDYAGGMAWLPTCVAMSASVLAICLYGASPCRGRSQSWKSKVAAPSRGEQLGEPAVRRTTNLFRRCLVASLLMYGEAWNNL